MRYANESSPPAERLEIMDEHIIDSFEFWGVEHAFLCLWHPAGAAKRRSRNAGWMCVFSVGNLRIIFGSPFSACACQLKPMTVISMAHFGAPAASSTPLPRGPILTLPGGVVGVLGAGRVFAFDRWVVAVSVSPDLFLMVNGVSEKHSPAFIREQLAGYLAACGAEVERLRLRFPLGWYVRGGLARTTVFWILCLIEGMSISREPMLGINRPRLALPIGVQAAQAHDEWLLVGRIWRMMEEEFPAALPQLAWVLLEISHRWEVRWALILRDAEQFGYLWKADQVDVARCDRAWIALVRQYLVPHGYEMLPATAARLL
jgi:hypothetical protein